VFGVCKTTSAILRGEGRSRRRTLDEANAHRISPRVFANLFKTPHRWPLLLAESDSKSLPANFIEAGFRDAFARHFE